MFVLSSSDVITTLFQVHCLVQQLPHPHHRMLEMLLSHLAKTAVKCDKNLMTVSNLGVCFGPTLLRPEEETVASIMDIKFANVVVEILIQNWHALLKTKPDTNPPPSPSHSKIKSVSSMKNSPTYPMVKLPPSQAMSQVYHDISIKIVFLNGNLTRSATCSSITTSPWQTITSSRLSRPTPPGVYPSVSS